MQQNGRSVAFSSSGNAELAAVSCERRMFAVTVILHSHAEANCADELRNVAGANRQPGACPHSLPSTENPTSDVERASLALETHNNQTLHPKRRVTISRGCVAHRNLETLIGAFLAGLSPFDYIQALAITAFRECWTICQVCFVA
jgi:hypothetical protein